jgi:uncharacterized protein DUF2188
MGKDVHVVKHGDGWATKKSGATRAGAVAPTQSEAIEAGRRVAQREHSELVIRGRDGKIREKESYGRDPYPPRG